jgi:hypothetical protein
MKNLEKKITEILQASRTKKYVGKLLSVLQKKLSVKNFLCIQKTGFISIFC